MIHPALLAVLDAEDPVEVEMAITACLALDVLPSTPEEDESVRECALHDIFADEAPDCEERPGDILFFAGDAFHDGPWTTRQLLV